MSFFVWLRPPQSACPFFFNETAPTEISTLSLHDALPIWAHHRAERPNRTEPPHRPRGRGGVRRDAPEGGAVRSEEHTSELQSPCNLVCRLLLEKKKNHDSTLANIAATQRLDSAIKARHGL